MRPNRSTAAYNGRFRRRDVGDVQIEGEEAVVVADARPDAVSVSGGRDYEVSCGERCLGDIDAHATASAGDEDGLLVGHVVHTTGVQTGGEGHAVPGNSRTPQISRSGSYPGRHGQP